MQDGPGPADRVGWTPQVVVALAVTRDGLPVRSWVLPGNTSDVTVVKRIRDDLHGFKSLNIDPPKHVIGE